MFTTKEIEIEELREAVAEVGDSHEFLSYNCDEDPDDIGDHNPTLLEATRTLQEFANGVPLAAPE